MKVEADSASIHTLMHGCLQQQTISIIFYQYIEVRHSSFRSTRGEEKETKKNKERQHMGGRRGGVVL